jgi:hypothetical protein
MHSRARLFKTLLAVLLALAWVPLTAHCQLESTAGLGFLGCASGEKTSEQGGSCCEDGLCCSWESEQYSLPRDHVVAQAPIFTAVALLRSITLETTPPDEVAPEVSTEGPQHFWKTWQFLLRAALPVRAPSLAS